VFKHRETSITTLHARWGWIRSVLTTLMVGWYGCGKHGCGVIWNSLWSLSYQ